MKKLVLSAAILGLIFTTSCSKDDDGGGKVCETCNMSLMGTSITTEYCDNGDGTMDVTVNGETETVNLEGVSFNDYIDTMRQTGMCN